MLLLLQEGRQQAWSQTRPSTLQGKGMHCSVSHMIPVSPQFSMKQAAGIYHRSADASSWMKQLTPSTIVQDSIHLLLRR